MWPSFQIACFLQPNCQAVKPSQHSASERGKASRALSDRGYLFGCFIQGEVPKPRPELKLCQFNMILLLFFFPSSPPQQFSHIFFYRGKNCLYNVKWSMAAFSFKAKRNQSEEQVLPAGQRCQGCLEDLEGQGCPGREKLIRKSRGCMSLPPKPVPSHPIPSWTLFYPHFCCRFCFYITCNFFYVQEHSISQEFTWMINAWLFPELTSLHTKQ